MKRCGLIAGMLFSLMLTVGCGGVSEVKPDAAKTPEVNEADVQKQIQEGMKMGGSEYGKYKK